MANLASTFALLYFFFQMLHIFLFENDVLRKLIFNLTPLMIPLAEIILNIYYLSYSDKNIKREVKKILLKQFLFDFYEFFEERSVMSGTQTYCNQGYNESTKSEYNIFPVLINKDKKPKIKVPKSFTLVDDSLKYRGLFSPLFLSFRMKIEVRKKTLKNPVLGYSHLEEYKENVCKEKEEGTPHYDNMFVKEVVNIRLNNNGLKLSDIAKSGLYEVVIKNRVCTLYEVVDSEIRYEGAFNFANFLEVIGERPEKFCLNYSDNKVWSKGLGEENKHLKVSKETIVSQDVTCFFNEEVNRIYKFGNLNIHLSDGLMTAKLDRGYSSYSWVIKNNFKSSLKAQLYFSCLEEYSKTGITKSISFCKRRERNINHCYLFQDLINKINSNKFYKVGLLSYDPKYINNKIKKNGFIITEGDYCTEIEQYNCDLSLGELDFEEGANCNILGLTILSALLNSIYSNNSKYFHDYLDIKKINLENKKVILLGLIKDDFDERLLVGVNNWQRKRIKSDLSSIKTKMGLTYLPKTDLKIKPTLSAISIMRKMDLEGNYEINNEIICNNIRCSEIPLKSRVQLERRYGRKSKINRSQGFIAELTGLSKIKPKTLNGEIKIEEKKERVFKKSISDLLVKGTKKHQVKKELFQARSQSYRQEYLKSNATYKEMVLKRASMSHVMPANNLNNSSTEKYNEFKIKADYKKALTTEAGRITTIHFAKAMLDAAKRQKEVEMAKNSYRLVKREESSEKSLEIMAGIFKKTPGKVLEHCRKMRVLKLQKEKETIELKNRFSVLDEELLKAEEKLKEKMTEEKRENLLFKEKMYSFLTSKVINERGVFKAFTKRQETQNGHLINFERGKVKKAKLVGIKNFSENYICNFKIDISPVEKAVTKFINSPTISDWDIKTFKPMENKKWNHPTIKTLIDKNMDEQWGKFSKCSPKDSSRTMDNNYRMKNKKEEKVEKKRKGTEIQNQTDNYLMRQEKQSRIKSIISKDYDRIMAGERLGKIKKIITINEEPKGMSEKIISVELNEKEKQEDQKDQKDQKNQKNQKRKNKGENEKEGRVNEQLEEEIRNLEEKLVIFNRKIKELDCRIEQNIEAQKHTGIKGRIVERMEKTREELKIVKGKLKT